MTEFAQIYQAYCGDVFRYLFKLCGSKELAEDLTSETFLKALGAIDSFRGQCSVRVWLCQIGKNCYYSYLRKNKAQFLPCELPNPDDLPDPAGAVEQRDEAFRIHAALHRMAEPYKEVFSLRVFGELTFRQIGALFDKSENWACVTFYRAKKKIQEEMER